MVGWQIQYWNGASWTDIPNAQIGHILEELGSAGGQEEFVFNVPNNATSRAIVQPKPFVQVLFAGDLVFPLSSKNAVVAGFKYSPLTIELTAYNYIYVQLKQANQTVTQNYVNASVAFIASYICGLAGVGVGVMPAGNVSIKFNNANPFKALQDLAKACGCEYWGDGYGFNIGTRDSTVQTLTYLGSNTKRGLDYIKQIDQVIINGVDSTGVAIQAIVGSPGATATFTEKKVSDLATLYQLAVFRLQTLNNPSNGTPLDCLITDVATWHPGQYVSLNREDLDLVGSFIIQRITKNTVACSVEVDQPLPQIDILLQDTEKYGDLGTYQAQPTTQTPSTLNLQLLLHLYHLIEGSGTAAADSTPNSPAVNGTITSGSWINGAIAGSKVLSFAGAGYVDCPITDVLTDKLAIGCWFSPSVLVDHGAPIKRDTNYVLELSGTSGAIRFGLHIGGNWVFLTAPAGTIAVNGRGFAMGVYDGTKMYLYVADPSSTNQLLTYSQAQTGNLDTATGDLFIGGSGYQGAVAEVMKWGRSVSAQEVQELFFRPLARIIAKSGGISGWKCAVDQNDPVKGTTTPSGISNVASGQTLQATANPQGNCMFGCWQFDGANYSTANPVTIPAQTDGSFHDLIAIFVGQIGVGSPLLGRIQTIVQAQILSPLLGAISAIVNTQILSPLLGAISAIVNTQILSPVISMLSTIVSIVVGVASWWCDCAYVQTVIMSPAGLTQIGSGGTLAVSATISTAGTALGYFFVASNPFKFDGSNVGTTAADFASASYTIPAQTNNTIHAIMAQVQLGWVINCSGTTSDGYHLVGSGGTYAATRSGSNTKWYLDGNLVYTGTSYTVPAQTNGTSHTLTCTT